MTESARACVAGLLLLLFFLPFALIGGVLALRAVDGLQTARAMQGWGKVPARIETLESLSGGFETSYAYHAQGRSFRGWRIGPEKGRSLVGRLQAQRFAELERALSSGGALTAWVDPEAPENAVLFREPLWDDLTLVAILACVFGGVGVVGSLLVALGTAQALKAARLPEWRRTLRAESRERIVAPSPWIPLLWSWCWAVLSCGIGVPLSWYVLQVEFPAENRLVLLVFLLPLLGGFLLFRACLATVGAWKGRRVRFRLQGDPQGVAGCLTGVVEMPGQKITGACVSLFCLETVTTVERVPDGHGNPRDREIDETRVLWKHTREVEPRPGPTGTEIPFAFSVPDSCPGTSRQVERLGPGTHSTIRWNLEVRWEGPGARPRGAGISVPVFRGGDGETRQAPAARRTGPEGPTSSSAAEEQALRRAGVTRVTDSGAGLEIAMEQGIARRVKRLGWFRVLKAVLLAMVLTGLYAAFIAWFVSVDEGLPTGLFVVLLVMATMVVGTLWFSLAATVLYVGEQISLDAVHLTVRHRFAFRTRVVRIPLRDLESVHAERCSAGARDAGYGIRLVYRHPEKDAPVDAVLSGMTDREAAGIVARKLLDRLRTGAGPSG